MDKIKSTIKNIFAKFREESSLNKIEDFIYDSIIILTGEELGLSSGVTKVLDCSKSRYDKVKDSPIYKMIEKGISKATFKRDNLLPLIYEYLVSREDKKEKYSIYYTPDWLVKYTVDNSLKPLLKDKKDIGDIDTVKILEPSCGGGMFLTYIFDVLFKWYKKNTRLSNGEIIKNIIERNIYGIDIDDKSLKICLYTLRLKCLKEGNERLDFKFNLYNMDFLKDGKLDKLGFDLIIGNPPYLENRRINKYFNKNELRKKYETAVGRFDIYSLFIEKSINLLKELGNLAFILPGNLLTNNNFYSIRKLILEKTNIKELVNLGEGIFDSVYMNMAIIILNKKGETNNNIIKCKNISNAGDVTKDIVNSKYKLIPQHYYNNLIKHVFDINSSETTFKLRKKIFEKGYTRINDVCEIIAGIATGNIRKKLLTKDETVKNAKKILEGKNITDYFYNWNGLLIIDDKSIIDKSNGEYATFMREEFIFREKILIRQTADRFICAYDKEGYYLLNTLYSLIPREEYKERVDIKYILALLNSKFYSFLYRSIVRESGKIFPQVKIFHIQNSPIIVPEKDIQNEVVQKVDKIIDIKNDMYSKGRLNTSDIKNMESEVNKFKKDIDRLVYNIFRLLEDEIVEVERDMSIY